jgi:hypothetical protein
VCCVTSSSSSIQCSCMKILLYLFPFFFTLNSLHVIFASLTHIILIKIYFCCCSFFCIFHCIASDLLYCCCRLFTSSRYEKSLIDLFYKFRICTWRPVHTLKKIQSKKNVGIFGKNGKKLKILFSFLLLSFIFFFLFFCD